tara:strand:- start:3950 stop:4123 length:174 start_codon:yes stop_codon:yes gene_type:complete
VLIPERFKFSSLHEFNEKAGKYHPDNINKKRKSDKRSPIREFSDIKVGVDPYGLKKK